MKLIRTVVICNECQMPYYKALWEPMWLVKRAAKEIHPEWHQMALNPETSPLAMEWRKWERERIIKLLEADAGKCIQTKPVTEHLDDYCNCRLIALIKGEQK